MTLPSVLSDPPWRRARTPVAAASTTKPRGTAASPAPPTLEWEAGERERFRGKSPPKMTEQAEEKLFERLLDELEVGEHDLPRFVGLKSARGRLFQLGRRGWRASFNRPEVTEYTCQLSCGAAARFEVSPSVTHDADDQVFTVVVATCSYTLDRLPLIDYSELVRDLEYATTNTP